MKTKIHALAGMIGFLTILTFWSSTLYVELLGSTQSVVTVKSAILQGMFVLIPAMVIVGATGNLLSKKRRGPIIEAKKKRMPFIAANGLIILVPAAFFLQSKAVAGEFDTLFYTVQGFELIAGAINLSLMGLNIRDGMKMTRRFSR